MSKSIWNNCTPAVLQFLVTLGFNEGDNVPPWVIDIAFMAIEDGWHK